MKEKRNVALLIDASEVLRLITRKYGMRPTNIRSVKGNGNGGNETPRIIPPKINDSLSFFCLFFSSGETGILYFENSFTMLIFFF
jgi:hypothetical protein